MKNLFSFPILTLNDHDLTLKVIIYLVKFLLVGSFINTICVNVKLKQDEMTVKSHSGAIDRAHATFL